MNIIKLKRKQSSLKGLIVLTFLLITIQIQAQGDEDVIDLGEFVIDLKDKGGEVADKYLLDEIKIEEDEERSDKIVKTRKEEEHKNHVLEIIDLKF